MLLQLLDHLVNADQLLSSPQAATLLTTPIPGSKVSKPVTAEALVSSIQVQAQQKHSETSLESFDSSPARCWRCP